MIEYREDRQALQDGEDLDGNNFPEETEEESIFLCPFCKGSMVLVDDERDVPEYVCQNCGAYYGEFLHTGRVFHYTPLHLRVGRAIIVRSDMGEVQSISSISVELSHEFGGDYRPEEIAEAILYLEKNGVLKMSGEEVQASALSAERDNRPKGGD